MSARLRIGVILDAHELRAWQRTLLDRIKSSEHAELAVVIVQSRTAGTPAHVEPFARRTTALHALAAPLLETTYRALERSICCEHDAFALCDEQSVLAGIPRVDSASGAHAGAMFERASRGHICIEGMNLDVILQLASSTPPAGVVAAPAHGVWYLESPDYPSRLGAPPGFWEVYFGHPVTRMQLVELRANGERYVLGSSASGTHLLSLRLNRSNAYWNALSLVPRKLAQLHSQVNRAPHTREPLCALTPDSNQVALEPGLTALAVQIFRNVQRRASERLKHALKLEQWILLFHMGSGPSTSVRDFRSIIPPRDRYWADPHILYRDGDYYVFVEEYSYENAKGHISVIRIDKDGRHDDAIKVLERPYHLSYPFVFEHAGSLYMVPESMDNRTVELYRCTQFPSRWEYVRNLLEDVWAVDSTLLYHAGKWWLFANLLENQGGSASEELFVFYTDCFLTGSWASHPLNPVVSDVTASRPAGPIQVRDGTLYRPSQDCSVRYGYAIRINEIAILSTEDYAEREVGGIKPDWAKNVLGTHTLAYAAGLTVVDALLARPRFGQHH